VVVRAREVLQEHENAEHEASGHLAAVPTQDSIPPMQLTMFTPGVSGHGGWTWPRTGFDSQICRAPVPW